MVKINKIKGTYCFCVAGTTYRSHKNNVKDAALDAASFAYKCRCFTDSRLLYEYAATL